MSSYKKQRAESRAFIFINSEIFVFSRGATIFKSTSFLESLGYFFYQFMGIFSPLLRLRFSHTNIKYLLQSESQSLEIGNIVGKASGTICDGG